MAALCFSRPPPRLQPCLYTVNTLDVEATCSVGGGGQVRGSDVYAQALVEASGARKVLVVNKANTPQLVTLAGAAGASWLVLDEGTAFGPARSQVLTADAWTLAPYALGVLRLPPAA